VNIVNHLFIIIYYDVG